jgi:hypothetical protein
LNFLEVIQPTVLAFTDPVFHFGPSSYAAAFRQDLLRAAETFPHAMLAVTRTWSSVFFAHFPDLVDRAIVADTTPDEPWTWPADGSMVTRATGNVLTNLMLPLAFALADEVGVAGCDGRAPAENYFWKHNERTQYTQELMDDVFEAHPSFFRDRDYADYYTHHCQDLEEFFSMAENRRKRVTATTPSYIPALVARGASRPNQED